MGNQDDWYRNEEWDEKIVFLHKIIAGSADKSYGIHVAKLAGVPASVNDRAAQILEKLEDRGKYLGDFDLTIQVSYGGMSPENAEKSMRLFAKEVLPEVQ